MALEVPPQPSQASLNHFHLIFSSHRSPISDVQNGELFVLIPNGNCLLLIYHSMSRHQLHLSLLCHDSM